MSFISVFDVLGPNMIGPSSSHTAGAAVIAYLAHKMIAPPLKKADFTLYGSFAKTYHAACPTRSRPVKPRPTSTRTPWTSAWRTPPVRS